MKTLIVGGSGFVSGAMARAALAAGHDVWTVTRGQRSVPDGVTSLIADRHDGAAFARAIEGAQTRWDLVIDCIGFTREDAEQDRSLLLPRCGHLVFISTDMVYDPIDRPWRIDESFDRITHEDYGRRKAEAERVLLNADGPPVTVLRPGHIYGPGSQLGCLPEVFRDPRLIERLRAGEPLRLLGGGWFLQQPVFVDDLCAMALSATSARASGGAFNAAGPEAIASRDYYWLIAEALGVSLTIEELPITPFLAEKPMHGLACHRAYAMDKAAAAGLNVPTTSMAAGIAAHVRWLTER